VERTITLATNIVTVGLALQAALIRQRNVAEATKRTREFLGNLIAANAAAIKTHTQEIGDLYINPVIAMDKITQAHNDLVEALDIADRLRQEGSAAGRTSPDWPAINRIDAAGETLQDEEQSPSGERQTATERTAELR
jgi:uncharacterized protein YaaN involved in tellurite resistance